MAGTPSAPGDEAEAVGEGATAAAASAREAKALAARVHELSRPRGAGGDHSCRSERDFTDFARAAEGWRKDREVLMSLCNLLGGQGQGLVFHVCILVFAYECTGVVFL